MAAGGNPLRAGSSPVLAVETQDAGRQMAGSRDEAPAMRRKAA